MESTLEDRIWLELFQEAQQLLQKGDHEKALKDFRGALKVAEKFDERDTRLVQSVSGLALAHSVRKEFDAAEPLFQRAVQLTEKAQGANHPDVAKVLKHLALIYSSQRKYESAEQVLNRAIKICQEQGPNHPDLALLKAQHEKAMLGKVAQGSSRPKHDLPKANLTGVPAEKAQKPVAPPKSTVEMPLAAPVKGNAVGISEAASADSLIGTVIENRYEVVSRLTDGGMSVIYKGQHRAMDRPVAIKILHPYLVANVRNIQRFKAEAQTASALTHQNICSVRDFGVSQNGLAYMIMDYLAGSNLSELIAKGGYLPAQRMVPILKQICDALAYAHENGVLHRDLKPSNVMLVDTSIKKDVVKIVDFGIAKLVAKDEEGLQLTQTGEVVGSPLYMSPEQCHGEPLDSRSDIYSLGCLTYKALLGCPPFLGRSNVDVYMKHVSEAPPPFSLRVPSITVAPELEAIVMQMLQKNPKDRQQSMIEIKNSLEVLKL